MPPAQTYENHARFYPLYHFFAFPVLVINALNAIRLAWQQPGPSTAFALVVAGALVALALAARVMALSVQDRVIRLEMQLRLHALLPEDLRAKAVRLTPKQLVALRFASDAELSSLVSDVLAGKLATPKAVKQSIQEWQADHLRA